MGDKLFETPSEQTVRSTIEMYCPSCERSFAATLSICPVDGAKLIRLSEGSDPLIGRVIDDRFRLIERVGSGGMGVVYKAARVDRGTFVAIKLLNPNKATDIEVSKRFLREAKLLSKLDQANTVAILDFGQDVDGALFLVMELLVGRELAVILEEEKTMSITRARDIGLQLCAALEAAHGLGIVHRDLKPGNVLVLPTKSDGDRVKMAGGGKEDIKVLDFGIAKSLYGESTIITQSDLIVGTPSYVAPETATGGNPDPRTDLYSLGVILYEMVSGRLPFDATTPSTMLHAHVSLPPNPLPESVPLAMRKLIFELLAKNPDDRPASASEVKRRLINLERHSSQMDYAETIVAPSGRYANPVSAGLLPTPMPSADTGETPIRKYSSSADSATLPRAFGEQQDSTWIQPEQRIWLKAGLAVVVGAAAVGVLAAVLGRDERKPPAAGEVTPAASIARSEHEAQPSAIADPQLAGPPAEPAPVEPDGPPAAELDAVLLDLETTPSGASVILSRSGKPDVIVCETPCEIGVPRQSDAGILTFRLAGHHESQRKVDLSKPVKVELSLKRLPIRQVVKKPQAKPKPKFGGEFIPPKR